MRERVGISSLVRMLGNCPVYVYCTYVRRADKLRGVRIACRFFYRQTDKRRVGYQISLPSVTRGCGERENGGEREREKRHTEVVSMVSTYMHSA